MGGKVGGKMGGGKIGGGKVGAGGKMGANKMGGNKMGSGPGNRMGSSRPGAGTAMGGKHGVGMKPGAGRPGGGMMSKPGGVGGHHGGVGGHAPGNRLCAPGQKVPGAKSPVPLRAHGQPNRNDPSLAQNYQQHKQALKTKNMNPASVIKEPPTTIQPADNFGSSKMMMEPVRMTNSRNAGDGDLKIPVIMGKKDDKSK